MLTKRTKAERMSIQLGEIANELDRARTIHPKPFHSAHEGLAILEEEFEELKEGVFKNDTGNEFNKLHRKSMMRKEAIQVAAMALRFIDDVCDIERSE